MLVQNVVQKYDFVIKIVIKMIESVSRIYVSASRYPSYSSKKMFPLKIRDPYRRTI